MLSVHLNVPENDTLANIARVVSNKRCSRDVPGRGGRRNRRIDEDSRPILVSSREDLSLASPSTENVLFAIDGDDDEQEASALDDTGTRRKSMAVRAVRSQDQVQFITPPLRCMLESREAGTSCMAIFSIFRAARRNRRCQLLRGHVPAIFTEFDRLDGPSHCHKRKLSGTKLYTGHEPLFWLQ